MKNVWIIFIALLLVFTFSSSTFAFDADYPVLSDFTDDDWIMFLDEYNVAIPTIYENKKDCLPFVRALINQLEQGSVGNLMYECYALEKFSNEIQRAIIDCYGQNDAAFFATREFSDIQDNDVYGLWKVSMNSIIVMDMPLA